MQLNQFYPDLGPNHPKKSPVGISLVPNSKSFGTGENRFDSRFRVKNDSKTGLIMKSVFIKPKKCNSRFFFYISFTYIAHLYFFPLCSQPRTQSPCLAFPHYCCPLVLSWKWFGKTLICCIKNKTRKRNKRKANFRVDLGIEIEK